MVELADPDHLNFFSLTSLRETPHHPESEGFCFWNSGTPGDLSHTRRWLLPNSAKVFRLGHEELEPQDEVPHKHR